MANQFRSPSSEYDKLPAKTTDNEKSSEILVETVTPLLRPTILLLLLNLVACATADERPNVVLILADDVGHECLGCYGGESYNTPNLDYLAKTGVRFQHCYSMTVCHPTRLTLMTGRYPFRFGDTAWGDFPKSAERQTFSKLLADAGYATAVAGKWQLTMLRDQPDHPYRLGFQQSDVFGWHEGPRYYEPMVYRNGKVRDDTLGHYGPDLYVRTLIKFMKENRDRPFVAYYPMALCHDVTDDLKQPVAHGPLDRYDSYPEMIAEMDRAVGRIVAALNALKLREKTLILFVGDNGTPKRMILRAEGNELIRVPVVSKQNDRDIPGGKGTLLDTGTHVPFIANWLGTTDGGQVVDDLVDVSDFWPTLMELAKVSLPKDLKIDGVSFASRLTQGERSPRQWAYSQGTKTKSRWVRTAKWKLYEDGRLFDMTAEGNEQAPVEAANDSEEQRAVRRTLRAAFEEL